MSETIPAVSEEAISDWVGSQSFQRGRSYFKNDAVFDPRRQGSVLKAWCQGSMPQPYRLHVAFGADGIEEAHCSCPVGAGGHCKHVGALLLTWLDQPGAFRVVAELDTALEQRSKGELIGLIKQMLQLQPDLETLLEVALPGGDRRRTLVDPQTYRRQVMSAFLRGADDWMTSWGMASEIGHTVRIGDGFLAHDDYTDARIVYQAVLQETMEHFEMIHDEEGSLHEVVDRCVQGLGHCLAGEGDDAAAREDCLRAFFEVYRFDVDYGGIGLSDAVPELILEHATDEEKRVVAGWVRAAVPAGNSNSWSGNYRRQGYGRFLLDLEEADLDDEAYLNICREYGCLTDLVDRLLMLGRFDEALAEAEPVRDYELLLLADVFHQYGCAQRVEPLLAQRLETSQDHRLAAWLKERHKEREEWAEALVLAQQLLQQRPYLAGYQEIREIARQLGVWQELQLELLAAWRAAQQFSLLTEIYLEEGEIEQALKLAKARKSRSYLYTDQLIRVAQAAAETHPHAAIDIYCQQAESLIEARGRGNYQLACTYLTNVRDLYGQLAQEPTWTGYITRLRERHQRLPALMDEMNKAGL